MARAAEESRSVQAHATSLTRQRVLIELSLELLVGPNHFAPELSGVSERVLVRELRRRHSKSRSRSSVVAFSPVTARKPAMCRRAQPHLKVAASLHPTLVEFSPHTYRRLRWGHFEMPAEIFLIDRDIG